MQVIQRVHLALPGSTRYMALLPVGTWDLNTYREEKPEIEHVFDSIGGTGHILPEGL